jgi:hypothetical protein
MALTARTMAVDSAFVPMSLTKLWSILILSKGKLRM